MDHELKRRLIGATVLISLAIIFLPMILEHDPLMVDRGQMIPIPSAPNEKFDSSLIRDEVVEAAPQVTAEQIPDEQPPAAAVVAASESVSSTTENPGPAATPVLANTKPTPKPGPTAWVIQVGSFSNLENAQKLVQRLRKAGLDTMEPQLVKVNNKKLYRVKVGPELDKSNAEKLLPVVKKVAGLQGKVIRYP